MKAGDIKKVAQAYSGCLSADWKRVGSEFIRLQADWAQIISFNASRFAEQYVPRSCLEFLKMPGLPTGSFLVQELQNPNGTQRWVKTSEGATKVFEEMSKQFNPSVHAPLSLFDVQRLLAASLNYWPHAYALCVMACEEGNAAYAERYFGSFVSTIADKPYPWATTRKQELEECLKLVGAPESLKAHLDGIRAEKLRALKLSAKG